jgi:hypothetical protein
MRFFDMRKESCAIRFDKLSFLTVSPALPRPSTLKCDTFPKSALISYSASCQKAYGKHLFLVFRMDDLTRASTLKIIHKRVE